MLIQEMIDMLSHLHVGENKFVLWDDAADVPEGMYLLTLQSKYGFRRFLVLPGMNIKEAQAQAIKIDADMCKTPRPEYCKKYMGLHFITIPSAQ